MKTIKKKMTWFGIMAVLAIVMNVVGRFYGETDFVNGFSIGLLAVSVVKMIQYIRIMKNEEMLKKFEINQKEERIIMISEKSGRYTLLLTIAVEVVAGIICIFLGNEGVSTILCSVAAVQTLIYTVIYLILSKKF